MNSYFFSKSVKSAKLQLVYKIAAGEANLGGWW